MKQLISAVCIASITLMVTSNAIAQTANAKKATQKGKEDSLQRKKELDESFEEAISQVDFFIINPQKRGDSISKIISSLITSTAYGNAINTLKELNSNTEKIIVCDALFDCKQESDKVEPVLKGLSKAYKENKETVFSDQRIEFKDTSDYKKLEDLVNFYQTTFLSNKEFINSAITKAGCNDSDNKPGVSVNTPTYTQLRESFVAYIGQISSRQQDLNREQKEKNDAIETKAETEYKIAGIKNGYYEAYANDYFGYNVWYIATIEKNITDKNEANTIYNGWKTLLTQCLPGAHCKEENSTDGSAHLSFESAYYKDYGNAHFKLVLRMMKDNGVFTVDFIIE